MSNKLFSGNALPTDRLHLPVRRAYHLLLARPPMRPLLSSTLTCCGQLYVQHPKLPNAIHRTQFPDYNGLKQGHPGLDILASFVSYSETYSNAHIVGE
jgi:hypothetical protein